MDVFIHAVVLAFGLILPLGVQNVFIFNQGLTQKKYLHALPAIITAGISDTLLIGAAVGGMSLILIQWPILTHVLYVAGSLFLLYMAWGLWKSSASSDKAPTAMSAGRQIAFAASVSILNPHALLDTVAVIGTSSIQYAGGERMYFTVTTMAVSWIWFLGLAAAGSVVGNHDRTGHLRIVLNRISALIMVGIALMMCWRLFNS
ncbi:LysE/ArgO family amino acid transporter [Paenibacillus cucumis (ex Kampfer et al. 2016)]|uniref:Amino acid transporter n=1 Tax=Paenibacillus cucumis (ex Kampfer et al. 2016) TaxID=1776858 RepID=A0ABS7KSA6_9BACL|nr:LysE/ArgO family amino acid transporter [Paenibacillus cucumis (ex Kampfer et al. 2016)]MBY0207055.1 amino acid transporter [Paenibacillus cucumis (ex Kampfer et al. 2016)]